jgi:glyoxylase-like metal-dependent hydrolase (beta-lactamase superfamily II)
MRVHHLNCATMCPPFAKRLVNPQGRMVCHTLLVETDRGLVLVDTGFGLDDVARPHQRLGRAFEWMTGPALDREETAAVQIERLGFSRADVRYIVPTHLDLDHAGGLSDFPDAEVHLYEVEHAAAMARATLNEKNRYKPAQWAHGPKWRTCKPSGEKWKGFDCVRDVPGLPPEILIVPVTGHTRGHAAIAVDTGDGWLLHAGDAYFYEGEMDSGGRRCTFGLDVFQKGMAVDDAARRENQERLRLLAKDHAGEVRVFSAHDPAEFDRMRARVPSAA